MCSRFNFIRIRIEDEQFVQIDPDSLPWLKNLIRICHVELKEAKVTAKEIGMIFGV